MIVFLEPRLDSDNTLGVHLTLENAEHSQPGSRSDGFDSAGQADESKKIVCRGHSRDSSSMPGRNKKSWTLAIPNASLLVAGRPASLHRPRFVLLMKKQH